MGCRSQSTPACVTPTLSSGWAPASGERARRGGSRMPWLAARQLTCAPAARPCWSWSGAPAGRCTASSRTRTLQPCSPGPAAWPWLWTLPACDPPPPPYPCCLPRLPLLRWPHRCCSRCRQLWRLVHGAKPVHGKPACLSHRAAPAPVAAWARCMGLTPAGAAQGMLQLHTHSPVIVHRDLKVRAVTAGRPTASEKPCTTCVRLCRAPTWWWTAIGAPRWQTLG